MCCCLESVSHQMYTLKQTVDPDPLLVKPVLQWGESRWDKVQLCQVPGQMIGVVAVASHREVGT